MAPPGWHAYAKGSLFLAAAAAGAPGFYQAGEQARCGKRGAAHQSTQQKCKDIAQNVIIACFQGNQGYGANNQQGNGHKQQLVPAMAQAGIVAAVLAQQAAQGKCEQKQSQRAEQDGKARHDICGETEFDTVGHSSGAHQHTDNDGYNVIPFFIAHTLQP